MNRQARKAGVRLLARLEEGDPIVWRDQAEAYVRWRAGVADPPFIVRIYETLHAITPEGEIPYEPLDGWARDVLAGTGPIVPEWAL